MPHLNDRSDEGFGVAGSSSELTGLEILDRSLLPPLTSFQQVDGALESRAAVINDRPGTTSLSPIDAGPRETRFGAGLGRRWDE